MAGGPAPRRPARSRRHALHPGRHQSLREQSGPVGWRHLRHAGPRGDAAHRGGGRSAGPHGHSHRRASPALVRAGRRAPAQRDRGSPGRARRGLSGLDPPGPDDLGLLRLYDPVQSRPVVSVLRLAATMAVGAAHSGRRLLRPAGRGLHRIVAVRIAGAGRSRGGPMAPGRARIAGAGSPVPGGRAHESRQRLRLPDRVRHAGLDPDRLAGLPYRRNLAVPRCPRASSAAAR